MDNRKGYVTDANGQRVEYELAEMLMDDELRERLHRKIAPCTNQYFYDTYCEYHKNIFGEDFSVG